MGGWEGGCVRGVRITGPGSVGKWENGDLGGMGKEEEETGGKEKFFGRKIFS